MPSPHGACPPTDVAIHVCRSWLPPVLPTHHTRIFHPYVRPQVDQPITVEPFSECAQLGRFTLRDEGKTIGAHNPQCRPLVTAALLYLSMRIFTGIGKIMALHSSKNSDDAA